MKTAIFVEGQTERIFMREYLLKIFDYQVCITCYKLVKGGNLEDARYPYGTEQSEHCFQIVEVGNDKSIISAITKRFEQLTKKNFDFIIGLRDVYSEQYEKLCGSKEINLEKIKELKDLGIEALQLNNIDPSHVKIVYAIMEVEAWFLAIPNIEKYIDKNLSKEKISEELSFSLDDVDPEKNFYKPSKCVNDIYKLTGQSYDKSYDVVNKLVCNFSKDDYLSLKKTSKCSSFNDLHNQILSD